MQSPPKTNSRPHKSYSWYAAVAATAVIAAFIYNLYVAPIAFVGAFTILFVFAPILLVVVLGIVIARMGPHRKTKTRYTASPPSRRSLVRALWILAWCIVAIALCIYNIPRKAAFLAFRPQFRSLERAPLVAPAKGSRLGPWKIIEAEVDDRGGLYIVTNEAADLIDTISNGPVYKPNATGTPFGRADYKLTHLSGDWFWFHANNDW